MSIAQHLSITFSHKRWRVLLLAVIVVYPVIGVVALRGDIAGGLTLSLLFDVVQLLLVEGALALLYRSTSKEERDRYSLDTRFYLRRYRDERHRFLALARTPDGAVTALTGVPPEVVAGLLSPVPDDAATRGLVVSHSILEWAPPGAMSIADVEFEVRDERYELPWVVGDGGIDTILRRFNAVDRHDYNGLTLATRGREERPGSFRLHFAQSFYYNYLITNSLPELRLPGGLTYRDLLEPGPGLSELPTALAENHLGMSCLLRTSDGHLVIPRRSEHTNVFKGQLSPSVSGVAGVGSCRDADGGYSPLAWLARELAEELPYLAVDDSTFPGGPRDHLARARVLGMTRELRRCGKPELFFLLDLPVDAAHVRAVWARRGEGEAASAELATSIDHNENVDLSVVHEDRFLAGISTRVRHAGRRWRDRRAAFEAVFAHDGRTDVLSESLLANVLLYVRGRDAGW